MGRRMRVVAYGLTGTLMAAVPVLGAEVAEPARLQKKGPAENGANGAASGDNVRDKGGKAAPQSPSAAAKPPAATPVSPDAARPVPPPLVVGTPPAAPAEAKPPAVAPIFDQPGVLTPSGTIVLEPSFQYINSSSNRVALSGYTIIPSLTIGLIDVRNVTSNTYLAALSARYGITSRLEVDARVPYVYRSDSTASQPANTQDGSIPPSVFTADGSGLGDIEFGARMQLNRPKAEGPYFIAGLRVKTPTGKNPFEVDKDPNVSGPAGEPLQTELPTGSGFWAFQPSLTTLFTSDPAAFFATVSYMWNKDREFSGVEFDPGDTIGFNFGVGVALNEKASFSLGYDHVILGKTRRDGVDLPGTIVTHVGTLLVGCSYRVSDSTSLNFSIGLGVTPAASNVQLGLKVPVSFLLGG